jgi:hypothetical protein
MAAALIHADRRTDMTKIIGALHDYAKALKDEECCDVRVSKSRISFWRTGRKIGLLACSAAPLLKI